MNKQYYGRQDDRDDRLHASKDRRRRFDDERRSTLEREKRSRRKRRPRIEGRGAKDGWPQDSDLANRLAVYRLYEQAVLDDELDELLGAEWVTYDRDSYRDEEDSWPYD